MTREDVIKTLKELWRETNDPWYEEVYNMAIKALEAVPSADRPQGEWVYNNEGYVIGNLCEHYDCDQCGKSVPHKTNYCPNCGARMKGADDE